MIRLPDPFGRSLAGAAIVIAPCCAPVAATTARLMAAAGARLVLMDPDEAGGHRLVLELNTGESGRAVFLPGRPSDPAELAEAIAECRRCWGSCDLVIGPA